VPRNKDGSFEADGLLKVRLVHAKHGSVLLPDHILVLDTAPFWLQPQWVSAPMLHFASSRRGRCCVEFSERLRAPSGVLKRGG
jgi:hypothetical protein